VGVGVVNSDTPPFKAGSIDIAPFTSSSSSRRRSSYAVGSTQQLYKGIALKRSVKGASTTTAQSSSSSSSLSASIPAVAVLRTDPISLPPIEGVLNTKKLTRKPISVSQPHRLAATAQLLASMINNHTPSPSIHPQDDNAVMMMMMSDASDHIDNSAIIDNHHHHHQTGNNTDDHSANSSSNSSNLSTSTGQHSAGYFSASTGSSYVSNSPMAMLSVPSVTIMKSSTTNKQHLQYVQQQQQQQQGRHR